MCKTSTTEERHLISIVVKNYIKSQSFDMVKEFLQNLHQKLI